MGSNILTVYTPTYNRAHLLPRLYESLCRQTCKEFEWLVIDDGSTDDTRLLIESMQKDGLIPITYIYKENGGLYTGYNTAYATIETELNVCIDSDDFMPEDAVETIIKAWQTRKGEYCGLLGLDYYAFTDKPIGGRFPKGVGECYFMDLRTKGWHKGDVKMVMRTDMMKEVAPQIGFDGEKNFNPIYMLLQVCDKLPMILIDKNLCFVDYQTTDSMSAGIFRQYINSPRSFAKMRRLEMCLLHNTLIYKLRSVVHYVAECRLAKDKNWLRESPMKFAAVMLWPAGFLLEKYIRYRAKSN